MYVCMHIYIYICRRLHSGIYIYMVHVCDLECDFIGNTLPDIAKRSCRSSLKQKRAESPWTPSVEWDYDACQNSIAEAVLRQMKSRLADRLCCFLLVVCEVISAPSSQAHIPWAEGTVSPWPGLQKHQWGARAGLLTHPCSLELRTGPWKPGIWGRSNIKAGIGRLPPKMPGRPGAGSLGAWQISACL